MAKRMSNHNWLCKKRKRGTILSRMSPPGAMPVKESDAKLIKENSVVARNSLSPAMRAQNHSRLIKIMSAEGMVKSKSPEAVVRWLTNSTNRPPHNGLFQFDRLPEQGCSYIRCVQ